MASHAQRETPPRVNDKKIIWTEMTGDRAFRVKVAYSSGLPIYLTDVERTLLDGIRTCLRSAGDLQSPPGLAECRGFQSRQAHRVRLDHSDIQNLRQRVYYQRREAVPGLIRGSRSGGGGLRGGGSQ